VEPATGENRGTERNELLLRDLKKKLGTAQENKSLAFLDRIGAKEKVLVFAGQLQVIRLG